MMFIGGDRCRHKQQDCHDAHLGVRARVGGLNVRLRFHANRSYSVSVAPPIAGGRHFSSTRPDVACVELDSRRIC